MQTIPMRQQTFPRLLALLAFVASLVFTVAAQAQVEIRLPGGDRWRGAVGDQVTVVHREQGVDIEMTGELVRAEPLFVVVRGPIAGRTADKTIFRADIIRMRTVPRDPAPAREPERTSGRDVRPGLDASGAAARGAAGSADVPRDASGRELGVFVLPLEGGVGIEFRHDEIKALGEHIDRNYGPGQTIVLIIDSNGGLVFEARRIAREIENLKQRHRVVSWIRKAISAGAWTAMCTDEIYFMREGTAGSVTTVAGSNALSEEDAQEDIDALVELAIKNGYSEHVARAMKLNRFQVSYDRDEETGVITWYSDLRGKYKLSDEKSNLTFNASNALHCGFSKGTADLPEDLAKQLDLPRWHEIDDFGRKAADRWQQTAKQANQQIPLLLQRLGYVGSGGDEMERLGSVIRTLTELRRWCDRAPLIALTSGLDKEQIDLQLELLRRQLAEMQRNRRR
ncbi:MAG: hypothetical protein KF817_01265 [Phycisphaeraceae bacterium]|nr:hypothetical protein [Phycisphaeraceae bacterium]